MVLELATIPFRALVWHLEKQLLRIILEKYFCNEMFMFKTRYRLYTSCFYLINGYVTLRNHNTLMFSHIFILYNKIFSEADPTQILTHPKCLKQPCYISSTCRDTASTAPRPGGRPCGPRFPQTDAATTGPLDATQIQSEAFFPA